MNFDLLFESFSKELEKRIGILTEDNVRYMLFAKMLEQDPNLNNYTLELPYKGGKNNPLDNVDFSSLAKSNNSLHQELDLLYCSGELFYAIEIKFHRPSMTATGLPNKAGVIFNDIKRLELIKDAKFRKLFVYVTDDEMHDYFINSRGISNKCLHDYLYNFYTAKKNEIINNNYLNNGTISRQDGSYTFFDCASKSFTNKFNFESVKTDLKMIYKSDFDSKSSNINREKKGRLHLRVYEIL